MDLDSISTPLAAFTAGVVTSFHCSAMCGPLSCSLLGRSDADLRLATGLYHTTRLFSYTILGGILGFAGLGATGLFSGRPAHLLPWAFVIVFLIIALGLDRLIPPPHFASKWLFRLGLSGPHPLRNASVLGFATPFLPCAPLYMVFAVALFSGSFFGGARLMALFALGTIPLYWALQWQFLRLRNVLSPLALQRVRRVLAFVSALILCWRAAAVSGSESPILERWLCH